MVLAVMIWICITLVLRNPHSEVLVAVGIFVESVSGFSLIAWMTFDAALEWRFVDFPWICTSFAAIVVALLNISEAGRREEVSLAKAELSRRFSDVIFATQSAVTNDCQDLPRKRGQDLYTLK